MTDSRSPKGDHNRLGCIHASQRVYLADSVVGSSATAGKGGTGGQAGSSSAAAQQQQRSSSSFTCSAEAEWGSRHPQGLAEVLFAVGLSVNQLLAIAAGVSQMLWLTDATCGPQHHAMH
jgi:hypothetical protein